MTFELIKKSSRFGKTVNPNQLTIRKTGFYFGEGLSDKLRPFSHCQVFIDRINKRIGFKPVNDKITGFAIGKGYGKSLSLGCGAVSEKVSSGVYNADYDESENMIIVTVKEILIK